MGSLCWLGAPLWSALEALWQLRGVLGVLLGTPWRTLGRQMARRSGSDAPLNAQNRQASDHSAADAPEDVLEEHPQAAPAVVFGIKTW